MPRNGDVQITWNESFFASILKTAPVRALTDSAINRVLESAESTAPVGDPATDPTSGDYKASLHVEHHQSRYRESARVVASDRKALLVESKKGTLARALKAAKRG